MDAENTLAALEEPAKKPGLVRGARDFIENTFNSLKGKDLNQAIEEFTGDMTLVIEGMSEDMNALRCETENLAAQLTMLEEDLSMDKGARAEVIIALKKDMDALEKRIKALEKPGKKELKPGLTTLLRQVTWIVGIFCASWVTVTILKLIGG